MQDKALMNDGSEPDDFVTDTATSASEEDQGFDTLDDAMDALEDDDALTEEQPDPEDGDSESEDGEPSDETDETDGGSDSESGDDVLVELGDGEQVPLGELKKGYFRQKDYTHKTEAVAEERKAVEAMRENFGQNAQSLQTAHQNLQRFLESLVPPEPDIGLAQSNPSEYQYQWALRNNALSALQNAQAAGQQTNAEIQKARETEIAQMRSLEESRLLAAMPHLKDTGRRAAFNDAIKSAALDFGFTEQEIASTVDHRILQLVHYARIGKKTTEQNRKNAGRRIAEKPRKGTRSNPVAGKPSKSSKALRAYKQTGSLKAAEALVDAADF